MKAAVIGMGPHGKRIVRAIGDTPGLDLAAVVDRREDVLQSLDLPASVARYTNAEALWQRGDIGLVSVATNGPSHAALSVAAINAGIGRLLVEKPMACSLTECDRIVQAAQAAGARVAVDHGRRHAKVYRWLRGQIASGEWGAVRALWIQRPDIGLGCNGTHSFDLAMYLADAPAVRVTGWVDPPVKKNPRGDQFVDPGGLVVMELANGVRASVAQIEDGAGPTSLEVDMTAARIRYCERKKVLEVIARDLSVTPGPGRPAVFRDVEPPDGVADGLDMNEMICGTLADLMSDEPLAGGASHGRAAVEVLVAAYLSSERGHVPVPLPLAKPEDLQRTLPVT